MQSKESPMDKLIHSGQPAALSQIVDVPPKVVPEAQPGMAGGAIYRTAQAVDRNFGRLIELLAAVLVVADVLLILASVTARYVFHQPIIWADEVAVMMFLWISMLGSAIAARRNSHMRLTTVVNSLSDRWKGPVTAFTGLLPILVLAVLLVPSLHVIVEHWSIRTPALQIPDGLRLTALTAGFVMMLIAMVPRVLIQCTGRDLLIAGSVILVIALALQFMAPQIRAIGNWNLVLFFVIAVISTILIGTPIAFAFGMATISYIFYTSSAPMTIVVSRMDGGISELLLLSIPLFVVLGLLLDLTGLARSLIEFLASLFGHVRGGLSYVLLGAMFMVSGISGSKAADMAAVAPVMLPEMKKRGYRDSELIALLSSSGAMSETIPPSLVLIAMGAVAGLSIAALFKGGLMPAAIAALALMVVAYIRSRKMDQGEARRASGREMLRTFVKALPILALPVLIRFAVVEGVATATEVATIGIAYTLLVSLMYFKQIEWRRTYSILVETATLTGAIMLIIGTATAMAWALTQSGFSQDLADAILAMPGGVIGFMLVSILVFALLGSLLEGLPALVLLAPILIPAAQALGINEIHYSMVAILSMGIGLFAPPFGVGYYMACAISNVSPDAATRSVWLYLAALVIATLVVAAVPWISTGLL
jgi:tripartite ATP-independent transporter DctM subunit